MDTQGIEQMLLVNGGKEVFLRAGVEVVDRQGQPDPAAGQRDGGKTCRRRYDAESA